jgi:hypothetical protein
MQKARVLHRGRYFGSDGFSLANDSGLFPMQNVNENEPSMCRTRLDKNRRDRKLVTKKRAPADYIRCSRPLDRGAQLPHGDRAPWL